MGMSAPAAPSMLILPKKSRLIVMESTADRLEVRTGTGFSVIYLIGMMFILVAFVITEVVMPQDLNWQAVAFAFILWVTFTAFLSFQSTHQWLRVAHGQLEYRLKLGPFTLSKKEAPWAAVEELVSDTVETESGGTFFAVIKTARWRVTFGIGCVEDNVPIDALVAELQRLRGEATRS